MVKKIPMRQCVGCGEMKSKKEMMRVLKTEDSSICLDMTGKKNGRGAYLCRNIKCLQAAQKKRALSRGLKTEITQDIYEKLALQLSEAADAE